jgi:hypothetical protein
VILAWKSRPARWILGILGVLGFLLAGVFVLRVSHVERRGGPARQIRVADDFGAWNATQVLPSNEPRKPWVEDAGGSGTLNGNQQNDGQMVEVAIRTPGPDGSLVGYSDLETTPEEAVEKAQRSLRDQVQALVEWELVKRGRFDPTSVQDVEAVRRAIGSLPAPSSLEVHQESVKLPESGSVAHRAAVRGQVPMTMVQAVASAVREEIQAAQRVERARKINWAWTFFSLAALALFVFLIYSFLNAGTKGHMAWPLRAASVVAFAVLCVALLILRGHLP